LLNKLLQKRCKLLGAEHRAGFSLLEVLVAMVILFLVIMGFAPLMLYLHQNMESNRIRAVAYNLAKQNLEQIRATQFDDVGTIGGNPLGSIPPVATNTTELPGVTFTINTQINWVSDPANAGGQDQNNPDFNPVPYNYKDVVITVSAPKMPGIVQQTLTLHSYAAQEGEETVNPGGNILVKTIYGWNTNPSAPNAPATGVWIDVTPQPPSTSPPLSPPQENPTDLQFGKQLFASLNDGAYTVHCDPSNENGPAYDLRFSPSLIMMVLPNAGVIDQDVNATEATTQPVTFEAETPCYLNLSLYDNIDLTPVNGATVDLYWPMGIETQQTYGPLSDNSLLASTIGPLWPVGAGYSGNYDILVQNAGYRDYRLRNDHPDVWTGIFSAPGTEQNLNLFLVPLPSVTATDSVYHTVISGAAVTWFTDTYSWDSVNKKWTVPPVESSLAGTPVNTGSNGVALLPDDQMTDSTQAPVTGQELPNSTYTCYGFQVSASDYNTQTFDSQFWVKKGQQMEVDSGVQNDTKMIRTVNVSLVPLP
jgi:prepilin-type N-terminal cleavage/methylation domain-containing protein